MKKRSLCNGPPQFVVLRPMAKLDEDEPQDVRSYSINAATNQIFRKKPKLFRKPIGGLETHLEVSEKNSGHGIDQEDLDSLLGKFRLNDVCLMAVGEEEEATTDTSATLVEIPNDRKDQAGGSEVAEEPKNAGRSKTKKANQWTSSWRAGANLNNSTFEYSMEASSSGSKPKESIASIHNRLVTRKVQIKDDGANRESTVKPKTVEGSKGTPTLKKTLAAATSTSVAAKAGRARFKLAAVHQFANPKGIKKSSKEKNSTNSSVTL